MWTMKLAPVAGTGLRISSCVGNMIHHLRAQVEEATPVLATLVFIAAHESVAV
jgi:hypothetical protein